MLLDPGLNAPSQSPSSRSRSHSRSRSRSHSRSFPEQSGGENEDEESEPSEIYDAPPEMQSDDEEISDEDSLLGTTLDVQSADEQPPEELPPEMENIEEIPEQAFEFNLDDLDLEVQVLRWEAPTGFFPTNPRELLPQLVGMYLDTTDADVAEVVSDSFAELIAGVQKREHLKGPKEYLANFPNLTRNYLVPVLRDLREVFNRELSEPDNLAFTDALPPPGRAFPVIDRIVTRELASSSNGAQVARAVFLEADRIAKDRGITDAARTAFVAKNFRCSYLFPHALGPRIKVPPISTESSADSSADGLRVQEIDSGTTRRFARTQIREYMYLKVDPKTGGRWRGRRSHGSGLGESTMIAPEQIVDEEIEVVGFLKVPAKEPVSWDQLRPEETRELVEGTELGPEFRRRKIFYRLSASEEPSAKSMEAAAAEAAMAEAAAKAAEAAAKTSEAKGAAARAMAPKAPETAARAAAEETAKIAKEKRAKATETSSKFLARMASLAAKLVPTVGDLRRIYHQELDRAVGIDTVLDLFQNYDVSPQDIPFEQINAMRVSLERNYFAQAVWARKRRAEYHTLLTWPIEVPAPEEPIVFEFPLEVSAWYGKYAGTPDSNLRRLVYIREQPDAGRLWFSWFASRDIARKGPVRTFVLPEGPPPGAGIDVCPDVVGKYDGQMAKMPGLPDLPDNVCVYWRGNFLPRDQYLFQRRSEAIREAESLQSALPADNRFVLPSEARHFVSSRMYATRTPGIFAVQLDPRLLFPADNSVRELINEVLESDLSSEVQRDLLKGIFDRFCILDVEDKFYLSANGDYVCCRHKHDLWLSVSPENEIIARYSRDGFCRFCGEDFHEEEIDTEEIFTEEGARNITRGVMDYDLQTDLMVRLANLQNERLREPEYFSIWFMQLLAETSFEGAENLPQLLKLERPKVDWITAVFPQLLEYYDEILSMPMFPESYDQWILTSTFLVRQLNRRLIADHGFPPPVEGKFWPYGFTESKTLKFQVYANQMVLRCLLMAVLLTFDLPTRTRTALLPRLTNKYVSWAQLMTGLGYLPLGEDLRETLGNASKCTPGASQCFNLIFYDLADGQFTILPGSSMDSLNHPRHGSKSKRPLFDELIHGFLSKSLKTVVEKTDGFVRKIGKFPSPAVPEPLPDYADSAEGEPQMLEQTAESGVSVGHGPRMPEGPPPPPVSSDDPRFLLKAPARQSWLYRNVRRWIWDDCAAAFDQLKRYYERKSEASKAKAKPAEPEPESAEGMPDRKSEVDDHLAQNLALILGGQPLPLLESADCAYQPAIFELPHAGEIADARREAAELGTFSPIPRERQSGEPNPQFLTPGRAGLPPERGKPTIQLKYAPRELSQQGFVPDYPPRETITAYLRSMSEILSEIIKPFSGIGQAAFERLSGAKPLLTPERAEEINKNYAALGGYQINQILANYRLSLDNPGQVLAEKKKSEDHRLGALRAFEIRKYMLDLRQNIAVLARQDKPGWLPFVQSEGSSKSAVPVLFEPKAFAGFSEAITADQMLAVISVYGHSCVGVEDNYLD
ncbi:MAG: hypothetical protein ACYCOU_04085, partial [Sulfobacillus sp.]